MCWEGWEKLTGRGILRGWRTDLDKKGDAALAGDGLSVLIIKCQVTEDCCCTFMSHGRDFVGYDLASSRTRGGMPPAAATGELVDVGLGCQIDESASCRLLGRAGFPDTRRGEGKGKKRILKGATLFYFIFYFFC